jgi:hypothetical protein
MVSDGSIQRNRLTRVDENVVAAPRHIPGPPSSREDGTENDDDDEEPGQSSLGEDPMEMSDDAIEEPKYAKTTHATKKSKKWPVGANGLRKRRILHTREYTDARGFLRASVSQCLGLDTN